MLMKTYIRPAASKWDAILRRPALDTADLDATVSDILNDVRRRGDAAVLEYTQRFDGVELPALRSGLRVYGPDNRCPW